MSIKKIFNGQTIRKPGAYSKDSYDNSNGANTISTDVVMVIGESSLGAPGATTGITQFDAAALSTLIATYGSGPLVDIALAAARPSKQSGINGASTILVYKTNASTQAQVNISAMLNVADDAWGAPGNNLAAIIATGSLSGRKAIQITRVGGTTENLGENQAQQVLSIHYTGNGTACTAAIGGISRAAAILTTTVTPASSSPDASASLSIPLKNYTMKTLCDFLNTQAGYSATLLTNTLASTPATDLDPIAATSIAAALVMQRLQAEIRDLINTSKQVTASIIATPVIGLPANGIYTLSGGAQGASANSSFSNGMMSSLAEDYASMILGISRDASEDIADANQGFTDISSTYDLSSVLTAMNTHLLLRGNTKNRKEAQGFAGVRKQTKAAAYAVISGMDSELMQMTMQDVLFNDATGTNRYMHPHVLAALAAGIRAGTDVGEPLTFKKPNVLDCGHFIDPTTGLVGGDFNPGVDYDDAIDAGVLFLEKNNAAFRFVVDNTTYSDDENFVLNRGSVMGVKFYVDKTLRQVAEDMFVGKKVSNGLASSIKNAITNKLRELNQPDVQIITSSDDAPEGFRTDTFVVTVQGNTVTVQVEYKPVQGLDFVFFNFTLGDITQSA